MNITPYLRNLAPPPPATLGKCTPPQMTDTPENDVTTNKDSLRNCQPRGAQRRMHGDYMSWGVLDGVEGPEKDLGSKVRKSE